MGLRVKKPKNLAKKGNKSLFITNCFQMRFNPSKAPSILPDSALLWDRFAIVSFILGLPKIKKFLAVISGD